jgi:hypothetical protein
MTLEDFDDLETGDWGDPRERERRELFLSTLERESE